MNKTIPYEKLSKKKKRERDAQRRTTWGALSPVTRKPDNSKVYNRRKARQWNRDDYPPRPLCLYDGDKYADSINAADGCRHFSHGISWFQKCPSAAVAL